MRFLTIKIKNAHTLLALFVLTALLVLTVVTLSLTTVKQNKPVSNQADIYRTRSDLLIAAMDFVGVCSAYDAVNVWSNAVVMRSGAMQYSVMTKQLKNTYQKQLENTFPNWVTGVSSPWISGYKITGIDKTDNLTIIYSLLFSAKTSTGPAGEYTAVLTVKKEGNFYQISNIYTDEGLYIYTGFVP